MKPIISNFPKALGSVAAAMLLALALGGCAGDEEELVYVERPVENIYNEAMD